MSEDHTQKASAHDSAGAVDPKVSRTGQSRLAKILANSTRFDRPVTPCPTTTPPARLPSSTDAKERTIGQIGEPLFNLFAVELKADLELLRSPERTNDR